MAGVVDLDNEGQSKSLKFPLYRNENHEATLMSGSVKSYGVKEGGSAIYNNKKSGYSVTADRLLWVDGWEKTTFEGDDPIHHQEMTLVVLRIDLASHDPRRKFGSANISLAFEASDEKPFNFKDEPQVQAWAPFHSTERYNISKASYTKSAKTEVGVQAGYSGVNLSGSRGTERGISWDRAAFDQGSSNPDISQFTGRRNGVTWILEQNELQNAGIQQTFYIAVLISRQTREPYLVKFQIEAQIGTMEDFKNKTKQFFGSNPGKTKPYLVTPWKKRTCNHEGVDIMKCVDLNNLGRLQNREKNSSLELNWELSHQLGIETSATVKLAEGSLGNNQAAEENRDSVAEEAMPASLKTPGGTVPLPPLSGSTAADVAAQLSLPQLVIGWQSGLSAPPVDLARLTALETRMAHLEARLAAQDSLMFGMQQALARREAMRE